MANELRAIKYSRGALELLDQKQLPLVTHYDDAGTVQAAWDAIKDMKVRGAPAIAISAALALAVEAHLKAEKMEWADVEACREYLEKSLAHLGTSRPTAVNLHNAVRDLTALVNTAAKTAESPSALVEKYVEAAEQMMKDDEADNRNISEHGAKHVMERCNKDGSKVKMVTICNTGALATFRYGTALGVIRCLHNNGNLERVYPLETRPYNQGSRLTAYECVTEGIPATLIVDSALAYLMSLEKINACVTGADRVCANGDTANKIGTYQVAVAAKHNNVPFYIAAPVTTIDQNLADGSGIPVEIRGPEEITHNPLTGTRVVAEGPSLEVWNPAFDVTPASLITGGIITELGVIEPVDGKIDVLAFLKKHGRLA